MSCGVSKGAGGRGFPARFLFLGVVRCLDVLHFVVLVQTCEHRAGMSDDEGVSCDQYHDSFQGNEQPFVVNQVAPVAFAQLVDSITAADQDEGDGDGHEVAKDLEPFGQGRGARRQALPFAVPPHVFACQSDENDDDDDLKGKTGDGNIDGGVTAAFGDGGEGPADGLQHQR